jgi:hypothetical protein
MQSKQPTKWANASTSVCKAQNPPPIEQRFKHSHNVENDQVKVSEHPWCVSCYALYIDVCQEVAKAFEDPFHLDDKGEFQLVDLTQAVDKLLSEEPYSAYYVPHLEKAIKAVLNCINARRYHHQNCYKRVVAVHGRSLQVGDNNHTSFLLILCDALNLMVKMCKLSLQFLAGRQKILKLRNISSTKLPLYDDEKYSSLINVCEKLLDMNIVITQELLDEQNVTSLSLVPVRKVSQKLHQKYNYSRQKKKPRIVARLSRNKYYYKAKKPKSSSL